MKKLISQLEKLVDSNLNLSLFGKDSVNNLMVAEVPNLNVPYSIIAVAPEQGSMGFSYKSSNGDGKYNVIEVVNSGNPQDGVVVTLSNSSRYVLFNNSIYFPQDVPKIIVPSMNYLGRQFR
jgi:hypothetical protein